MTIQELQTKYPDQKFGKEIHVRRDYINIRNRDGTYIIKKPYIESPVTDEGWKIFLMHSCDQWIIGNANDAETMANDLLDAAKFCKQNP